MAKNKNYNWPKIAEKELAKLEDLREDDLKYLARDFARKYKIKEEMARIYLKKAFLKRNNKSEATKKNNELLDDAYTFANQVLQRKGTEDIVNSQLAVFYQFESDGLTLEQSYEIIHKAKEEFEQAIKEESEFKTGQELISKKETEISTSIEVHGESQDEIEKIVENREEEKEKKPEKTSKQILEQVIDDALTASSNITESKKKGSNRDEQLEESSNSEPLNKQMIFQVKCLYCKTPQQYKPTKTQKRRRKLCILCKKRFTVNPERILKSDRTAIPTLVSTSRQSRTPSAKRILKNQKSIIPEIIDFIQQIDGSSNEKKSLIKLLKKQAPKNSQNDFFSENSTKGVQGWGGETHAQNHQKVRRRKNQSNGAQNGDARRGHNQPSGHDIHAHSKNQNNHRTESEFKDGIYDELRGGMPSHLNSGHARDDPGHSKQNSNDPDGHATSIDRDPDNPGPGKPKHSNDDNREKGIYVVHTPLEFVHLQFKDEVGRLHDHRLAMLENLSPRRFGITQTLADKLQQLMDPPHWKDPAKQYRKKVLGEFVFILTKDNNCILYPKHPFGDQEFFKWMQNHLTKNQMRNLAYYYSLAASAQKNELATPRIKNLTDEDPANFTIKVQMDNPEQKFFVRRDKSKGDAIEYWGPTRQGFDWVMRYLEPVIEHSISIQTHDKVKELRGRLQSQDNYLRNEIPKMQHEIEQNGHVLLQLKNKHRVIRALSDHLRDYFDKSLAQGDQRADILADIKQELQDQTVELVKTVRDVLQHLPQPQQELPIEMYVLKERTQCEQVIIDFLKTRGKKRGYTRKEIALEAKQNFNSVSPTVSKLVKEGVLLEQKEDRKAGRYLIK